MDNMLLDFALIWISKKREGEDAKPSTGFAIDRSYFMGNPYCGI